MRDLITSRTWWGAALRRMLRTCLATLVGTLPVLLGGDARASLLALSTIALAAVLSLATSLAGLPELTDVAVPWWRAALQRAARTLGQMLAAAAASAVVLTDISWDVVGQALLAAVVTLILAAIDALPEVALEDPLADSPRRDPGDESYSFHDAGVLSTQTLEELQADDADD